MTVSKQLKKKMSCNSTRAGRKKAGLPSPPSHFKFGRRPSQKTSGPSQTDIPSDSSRDSQKSAHNSSSSDIESNSGDEDSERQFWVQCEHDNCKKWRILPKDSKIDAKSAWYCSMHPDPAFQSCDVPEQKWKREGRNTTRLCCGQLVWAKMHNFCPWPAIVTPDPWAENEYTSTEREGCIYHVEFLGKKRTHLWLTGDKVEPYCSNSSSLGNVKKSAPSFNASITEAEALKSLTDAERLATCTYVPRALKQVCRAEKGKEPNEGPAQRKNETSCRKKARKTASSSNASNVDIIKNNLQMVFSMPTFNLQEFIQTNFKLESDGCLKLVATPTTRTSTTAGEACKDEKAKKRRVGRPKSNPTGEQPGKKKRESTTRPGRRKKIRNTTPKQISPRTLRDYFSSNAAQSKGTNKASTSTGSIDQLVPILEMDGFSSMEAQALKEMEEIEGMLTMFEDSNVSPPEEGEKDHYHVPVTESEAEGRDNTITDSGIAVTEGSSEWVESVLGEISQIEDLIQDISRGHIVPYTD